MTHPVIELRDLEVRVKGRTILSVEHLQIYPGERIALLGPNGAGKSTFLKVLTGLAPSCQGSVQVLGYTLGPALDRHAMRRLRAQVGQVLQGLHLVARLSVMDNVLIGCLARLGGWRSWVRWHSQADQALAMAALDSVGLRARAAVRADRLSGGERQKVALARLLMQAPRVILADEPTAALDPTAATEVCGLLVEAARTATLITVVHNPTLVPLLAQRVIGLRDGRVVFDRPAESLDAQCLDDLYRGLAAILPGVVDD